MPSARLKYRAWRYRLKLNPGEIRLLRSVVPRGGAAIDIGAHKGAYTWWLAKGVGASGRVVAVEPQTRLAAYLRQEYAALPHVSIVEAAMADRDGELMLSTRGDGSSHGASIHGFEDEPDAPVRPVQARKLSSIVTDAGLTRLDFIKCDCEGAELSVFAGESALLARFRPVVLCEAEARHSADGVDHLERLIQVFTEVGYQAEFFLGRKLKPIAEFDPTKHQNYGHGLYANNFLFRPATANRGA